MGCRVRLSREVQVEKVLADATRQTPRERVLEGAIKRILIGVGPASLVEEAQCAVTRRGSESSPRRSLPTEPGGQQVGQRQLPTGRESVRRGRVATHPERIGDMQGQLGARSVVSGE